MTTQSSRTHQAKVYFKKHDVTTILSEGDTLLEAANRSEIGISAICGGKGLCAKCRVAVLDGEENLDQVSSIERISLSDDDLRRGYRLACCARMKREGTVVVDVPPESSVEHQRLLVAGVQTSVSLNPAVKKYVFHLTPATLQHIQSDAEILQRAATQEMNRENLTFSYHALSELPPAIRTGNWVVTATIYANEEIIRVQPGGCGRVPYGLAVDIGSTKLAAYLMSLNEGKVVATASCSNPQITFGDDIISRISYAGNSDNLKKLQGVVVAAVNKLLSEVCRSATIPTTEVYEIVAVGNTAMHHLFLGIDPKYIALAPYPPAIRTAITLRADEIGLHANRSAYVYLLPIVAGFVGGDALADVLATKIYESEKPCLLIDVGTNTEIVLGDRHRLMSCSCASGPALEGGCVTHGMRAETGAIERVYINPQDLEPGYQTIGDAAPRGICGSGILDVVSSLLQCKLVDQKGKLNPTAQTPRIRTKNNSTEYVLVWGKDSATRTDIVINQYDIQQIQLAKAAIYAGASILKKHMHINDSDISTVYLAGAFGTYVDPQSALTVGMYPDVTLSRIRFVGNAAGSGARMALLSTEIREKAEQVAKQLEYLELAADKGFSDEFMNALFLPHRDPARFPTVNQLLERRNQLVG